MNGGAERFRLRLPRRERFTSCGCKTKADTFMKIVCDQEWKQNYWYMFLREMQLKGEE